MNKEKITSQEIIDLVASKASVSKRAAEEFLRVMIATIEEALLAGETVKVKNFGTFKLQWNEARKSVNVQTGEQIILSGHHKVSFTPDALLKDKVNEPFAHLEPVQLDSADETDNAPDNANPDELSDPLRIFTEQANEIKNLISEIQALNSITPVNEVNTRVDELEDEEDVEELEDAEEAEPEIVDEEFIIEQEIVGDEAQAVESEFEIHEVIVEENIVGNAKDEDNIVPAVQAPAEEPEAYEVAVNETDEAPEDKIPAGVGTAVEEEITVDETFEKETSSSVQNTGSDTVEEKRPVEEVPRTYFTEEPVFVPITEKTVTGNNDQDESVSSPFIDKIQPLNPPKKRRRYKVLLAIVLLVGIITGLYMFFPPATRFMDRNLAKANGTFVFVRENMSMTEMMNTVSKWVNPAPKQIPAPAPKVVVVPKDTQNIDTLNIPEPPVHASVPVHNSVDTLQMLFDHPRVYKEFIATEKIKGGSRLALMALHYYGTSDFWVYIYEANMEKIPDPDNIAAGTLIRIPKLDPRLIDASNPRCIQKAKELHDLYVK